MRSRVAANRFHVTATSPSWKVTYLECGVSLAPIWRHFSRNVVSDQEEMIAVTNDGRLKLVQNREVPRRARNTTKWTRPPGEGL